MPVRCSSLAGLAVQAGWGFASFFLQPPLSAPLLPVFVGQVHVFLTSFYQLYISLRNEFMSHFFNGVFSPCLNYVLGSVAAVDYRMRVISCLRCSFTLSVTSIPLSCLTNVLYVGGGRGGWRAIGTTPSPQHRCARVGHPTTHRSARVPVVAKH